MDTLKVYSIVFLMHFILKETEHIDLKQTANLTNDSLFLASS